MNKTYTILVSMLVVLSLGMLSLLVVTPANQAEDFDQPGYALIAAPKFGANAHSNEALDLRDYLIDKGWDDDRIILLGKWTNKDYVDGTATKANIQDGIDDIAAVATDDDLVFVAVLDHAQDGNDGHIYFRTGDDTETYIQDDEFAGWIDDITNFRYLVVYVASPYSGTFVEGMDGDNRIVLSDCAADQLYTAGAISFYKGLTKSEADTDNDSEISIEEAHAWMEDQKKKLDPQMADYDETEDVFLY